VSVPYSLVYSADDNTRDRLEQDGNRWVLLLRPLFFMSNAFTGWQRCHLLLQTNSATSSCKNSS
jgi:hypothetical protein